VIDAPQSKASALSACRLNVWTLWSRRSSTPTPPGVISISYGECEAHLGSAANKTFDNLYLSAAVMGISVFVSSGDSFGYVCNGNNAKFSTLGLAVGCERGVTSDYLN
jgi:subtilase family serine protease